MFNRQNDSGPELADFGVVDAPQAGPLLVPTALASWWDAAAKAYAPESVKAMRQDLRHWYTWCQSAGVTPWPITVDSLVAWLSDVTGAVATVRRRSASLRMIIRASDGHQADPTRDERFRMAFKAACRRLAAPQQQAAPWTWQDSQKERQAALQGNERQIVRVRDQAILRLAYDTLARSSEVRALLVSDVRRNEDGSGSILLRKTKTDQARRGTWRFASQDTMRYLDRWLAVSHIAAGAEPLFQGLAQGLTPTGEPLSEMGLWRVYRRMGKRAAPDTEFSAHSTRVGAAVDMVAVGLDLPAIMQAGGWKSPEMVARYSAPIATTRGAAAQLAHHQNRT